MNNSNNNSNSNNAEDNTNTNHCPDVLCLQEWDLPNAIVAPVLQRHGYTNAAETPRVVGGGAGGRTDACVVYVRTTTTSTTTTTTNGCWEPVEHQIVRFDDLATLSSTTAAATATAATTLEAEAFNGNNLQGIQRSLLRRNMGLLVRLRHRPTQRTVVVANAHLYWNPGFDYVKVRVCVCVCRLRDFVPWAIQ